MTVSACCVRLTRGEGLLALRRAAASFSLHNSVVESALLRGQGFTMKRFLVSTAPDQNPKVKQQKHENTEKETNTSSIDTEKKRGLRLTEVSGDLFSSTDSLAHCISADIAMGKGIAVTFKERFGGVAEMKGKSAAEGRRVGGMLSLPRDGRHIYYLITKERYFHKPTYATLESSLREMRRHMEAHGVTRLSIPRLGCGLDQLQWPEVQKSISRAFDGYTCDVTVYNFAPPPGSTGGHGSGARGRGGYGGRGWGVGRGGVSGS